MHAKKSGQAGYSLIEMITVVAIVGILALVTVPQFMAYRNSNKMKSAMRSFTTDLRNARQMAITRGREVKLSFKTGVGQRTYDMYVGDRAYGPVLDANWTALTGTGTNPPKASKMLEEVVYFPDDTPQTPQSFTDLNQAPDNAIDVVFYPDGRAQMPGNAAIATITLKSDLPIPRPQYAVQITPSGRVLAK